MTTSKTNIDLSVMEYHPWPECFIGAVAKLLDDAHIPNSLWGDLLYWWRGNPHIPMICGFIVPSEMLETAVTVVEQAGLSSCSCKRRLHTADPAYAFSLPTHFRVPIVYNLEMTLFLCPSDKLLDLIPLDPSHRNPVGLKHDLIALPLYDRYRGPITLRPASGVEIPSDYYVVRALSRTSLIEVLLLLAAFRSLRDGVGHSFADLLRIFALASKENGPYVLQSPSLQRLWDIWYLRLKRSPDLWDNVRLEWREKLSL